MKCLRLHEIVLHSKLLEGSQVIQNVSQLLQYGGERRTRSYLEGIEGTAENEQAIVSQRSNHTQVSGVAYEVDLTDARVVMDHLCGRMKPGSSFDGHMGRFFFFPKLS